MYPQMFQVSDDCIANNLNKSSYRTNRRVRNHTHSNIVDSLGVYSLGPCALFSVYSGIYRTKILGIPISTYLVVRKTLVKCSPTV